jgi:hypothetical protein
MLMAAPFSCRRYADATAVEGPMGLDRAPDLRNGGPMALRTTKTWWGTVLDAPDGPALAQFYARLLGWQVFPGDDGGAVAPAEDAGYYLGFQTEEHYVRPVWPAGPGDPQMSMHLDIAVDDLEQAVAHAVECGAVQADHQPQDDVRVMLDPAGHPFCLYLDPSET